MATPPPIDRRTYDDIVRQTTELAQENTPGWQPQMTDAGTALIRIFGRMAALVSDRLNRAPEKNLLAFLDLIGTQIRPPQPARVPLTFELAVGSQTAAYVPAHTPVAAQLPNGQEVVFETEQELVVTPAQIVSAFVSDPEHDRYRDSTASVTGAETVPEPLFEGDRPSPHALYFACDELLTLPGGKTVTVQIQSPEAADLSQFPITWSVWDGAFWQPVLGIVEGLGVTLEGSEIVVGKGRAIDAEGKAIVLTSDRRLRLANSDRKEIIGLGISAASAQTDTPILKQQIPLGTLNAAADTIIPLARLAVDAGGNLRHAFQTQAGPISTWEFKLSQALPTPVKRTLYGIEAAWLRATLHAPLHAEPSLPQLTSFQLQVKMEDSGLRPERCSLNTAPLDISKDFFPFGEQPRFNDTVYIGSQAVLSKAGAKITVKVAMSTPPPLPVSPSSDLELEWEVWTGEVWQTVKPKGGQPFEDGTKNLTTDGQISFLLPDTVALAEVGGETRYWLRGRIVRGGYRTEPATASTALREAGSSTLAVHDMRGFLPGDRITLADATTHESADIDKIDQAKQEITLKAPPLSQEYAAGARVLLNGFGAPSLKSLSLGYEYTSPWVPAACLADNDFTAVPLATLALKAPASAPVSAPVSARQRVLPLTTVASLAVRDDRLSHYPYSPTWQQVLLQTPAQVEIRDIAAVDFQAQTITLTSDLEHSYDAATTLVRVCAQLTAEVKQGSYHLPVRSVDGLTVGLSLSLVPVLPGSTIALPPEPANAFEPEIVEIEALERDRQWVILRQPVRRNYPPRSTLSPLFRPFVLSRDRHPTLYLGFDRPPANRLTTLYVQVEPAAADDNIWAAASPVQLTTEYSSPVGWSPLGTQDETRGFSERGLIQFMAPSDLQPRSCFGQRRYWLRVRWHGGVFALMPRARWVLTNTMWASQTTTRSPEMLGSSSGDPGQTFTTTLSPVLMGQRLEVQENALPSPAEQAELATALGAEAVTLERDETGQTTAVWVGWQPVPDFYSSTPRDRHYTLDHLTGTIRFGDGQAGRVPPQGRNNLRLYYQSGGGSRADLPPHTATQLKTTIPFVARVTNLEAGGGGSPQESLAAVQARGPKQLRHRGRAVTLQDFEDLALEASPDVARAKAFAPEIDPLLDALWLKPHADPASYNLDRHNTVKQAGQVKLLIVPYSAARQPTPSLALLERVADYLRSRCCTTLSLQVVRPQWQEVVVTVTIVPVSMQGADAVRSRVLQRLESFLHPLTGGPRGEGWPFGRHPHDSDLYAAIAAVPGVDHVHSLYVPPGQAALKPDTLVFSGRHSVELLLPGSTGEL